MLLERERELGVLRAGLRQARDGPGVGLAVAGDSGAGKSTVIAAALDGAVGLRVLRGQCDPLGTPRPLGPFRELALMELGGRSPTEEPTPTETAETILDALASEPTVLVVEDLHWVDAASADVLRYVLRRVETVPVAVVVSYRSVEIGARHPARQLLGDFAVLDGLRTLTLQPLSLDGVAAVVGASGLDPAHVHRLTGGNPFYVTAVVQDPDRPLPASVRDAILARTGDLDPHDVETLQLIACSVDGLDDRLLPLVGVDLEQLRRLDATTLLRRTERGIAFRHELARQAVESTIPPGGTTRLHQRLLDSLETLEPLDPATLTHHALAARDGARTLAHARAAAAESLAAGSNSEAAAFLQLAVSHLPSRAPVLERAGLLMQLAQQQYVTGRLDDASATTRAAIPLWKDAGHLEGVAQAEAVLCVLEYQSGHPRSRVRHAAAALDLARHLDASSTVAQVYADTGMVALVVSDLAQAAECGRRAEAAGAATGLEEYVYAGQILLAAVGCADDAPGASERVAELTRAARRQGWDEIAWRGFVVQTLLAIDRGQTRLLQRVVDETLAHTIDRDLKNAWRWHLALRAVSHAFAGRWSAAREDASESLATGTPQGTIWPHLAMALAAQRVGDEDATAHLERAWRLAVSIEEPGRFPPVLAALAEAMWLTGRPDPRVTQLAVERLPLLAATPDQTWPVADLFLWLRRAGVAVDPPARLPEPHRAHLDGRYAEAADHWQRVGNAFAAAMVWADSDAPDDRVRAVGALDRLGAAGTADRIRRQLRLDGLTGVPSRPIDSTRANPGGLTNRQLEVARLVARGLTNSEIAAQSFISPKTAEHHVSAVLTKLGVANRRELQTRAADLGLD